MAEGLLRALGGGAYEAMSAGTHPVGLNPLAVTVMTERGIDISRQRSKALDEFLDQRFDWVITVCDGARESCPNFPGAARRLHWSLDDPAAVAGTEEERLEAFRRVRDEIREHIRLFVAGRD
jgi:arsenate reductase